MARLRKVKAKTKATAVVRHFVHVDFVGGEVIVSARLPKRLSRVVDLVMDRVQAHLGGTASDTPGN